MPSPATRSAAHHPSTNLSPSLASLADDAVFYPGSAALRSAERLEEKGLRQEAAHARARKRDRVKMVGHNLHTAFKTWFKEVSESLLLLLM